ncbi:MAG: DVUA0089 family protein [Prochloraceae cyanobacterium]|nr:DVUA0089 family protein [Prochloraceae cyanobacterium]
MFNNSSWFQILYKFLGSLEIPSSGNTRLLHRSRLKQLGSLAREEIESREITSQKPIIANQPESPYQTITNLARTQYDDLRATELLEGNNLQTIIANIENTYVQGQSNKSLLSITGSKHRFSFSDLKSDRFIYKVGFELAALSGGLSTAYSAFTTNSSSLQILNQGQVVIDAYAATDAGQLLADLEALGLTHGEVFGNAVSGILPLAALEQMASLKSLQFARAPLTLTNVGATDSQADLAMRSNVARTSFGVKGTGVTVGMLSDSYNNLGGESADILSGDLPGTGNPLGNITPVNVLQDLPSTEPFFPGIDEGRGMAQLVHDVAPGAALAFHSAFLGQASFANGIIELASVAGSNVIVDDVIYFAEPMFQDGIIAQAVDQVVASGVSYFSSAGNRRRNSYESEFRASGQLDTFFGGQFHDFDPGAGVDIFQSVTIPVDSTLTISFQWDSAFFSVSGGAGSPNDLDIFLFDRTGTNLLDFSVTDNIGADAVEIIQFTNNGGFSGTETEFNLAISQVAGPEAGFIKYVRFGSSSVNEYDTQSPTTYGHNNARGAEAVGAAFYQNTPEFGVNPARLESFSSAGGTPILFDTAGNRLATPEIRQKPEIVAPDGTNTTFFPPSNARNPEGDGFPNFFGTSAAAPHAAAVAALMLEAAPGTSPEVIYQTLESTALDMDDPSTPGFDVGFDNGSGYGLIQADKAIQALLSTPPVPQPVPEPNDIILQAIATGIGIPTNPTVKAIFTGRIGDNPNIFVSQDVDLFELQLNAGERVTFDIDTDLRSGLNSVLRLFDSAGNEVAVSDNDPAPGESFGPDSYIDFTATASGTYYLGVSSFDNLNYNPSIEGSGEGFSQGDYELTIKVVPDLPNRGFETTTATDTFPNWQTLGNVKIETALFGPNPTEGTNQALLTNGAGSASDLDLEVFVGLQPGELELLGNGFTTEGSAIKRTVNVSAGDTLSFDFNFLTNERAPDSVFNDFAFVSITPGTALELADTNSNLVSSNTIFNQETEYSRFSYTFKSSGTFTLAVGVVDVVNNGIDSALLVDNFSIV